MSQQQKNVALTVRIYLMRCVHVNLRHLRHLRHRRFRDRVLFGRRTDRAFGLITCRFCRRFCLVVRRLLFGDTSDAGDVNIDTRIRRVTFVR